MARDGPPDGQDGNGRDDGQLARVMAALGTEVRLDILRAVRQPRLLGEIRVQPRRRDGGRRQRPMNRVSVRQHLDRLLAIGAVRVQTLLRDGRPLPHYIVNHPQLYALGEELRRLARMRPQEDRFLDGTQPGPAAAPPADRGPRLLLVNGADEGRAFPLGPADGARRWTIGRAAGSHVCLGYDPYVSLRNSEVRAEGRRFLVRDLPGSRNGTQVNWRPLPPRGDHALADGDVIGVGRSSLLFRAG